MKTTPRGMTSRKQGLLILAPIAAYQIGGRWHSLDLWARDINEQAKLMPVTLLCPVAPRRDNVAPLDPSIAIVDSTKGLTDADLRALVTEARYVQIPGNFDWRRSRLAIRLLRIARANGAVTILGISSNRARTAIFNSRGKGVLTRARAYLRYLDIRMTQKYLARRVSGVFLVGSGLLPLVEGCNPEIHVATASWITESDVVPPVRENSPALRLCLAGRLEHMKGFHIGLAAIANARHSARIETDIAGAGPERDNLEALARTLSIDDATRFVGTLGYPREFLEFLGNHDAVLLTNLNDEQPRLIFDAIARGCLPICPDNKAYLDLGLDPRLIYRQADADDLTRVIRSLKEPILRSELQDAIAQLAQKFTLGEMHRRRLDWMQQLSPVAAS